MTFTPEQTAALAAKLAREGIKMRTQAGRTFSYVEGWEMIAEANRIFGFDGWTRETIETRLVAEHQRKIGPKTDRSGNPIEQRDGWGVSYIAKVRVVVFAGDTLVTREGLGAGHGIDVDLGLAHESAIKEAETDSMKRALMTFGNPFGLALYDKDQEGVEAPEPARKPSARPEPSPPQREAIKVASDTNVTSGVQPPTADERAATSLILQLSSCKTENEFLDVKGSEAFRKGRMALGEGQRKRLDDTGNRLAARFPANPIAGG